MTTTSRLDPWRSSVEQTFSRVGIEASSVSRPQAGQIAKQLGNALVAPVVSYVPEGDINPPTGHMRFAGTISLPQDVFVNVLEYAARSLRQHGFVDVALVGDSGGNQAGQKLVADALNKDWAGSRARVHYSRRD